MQPKWRQRKFASGPYAASGRASTAGKLRNHGPELYGYRRDKTAGIRTVYQPEAVIVQQIFQWYVDEHLAFRAIVRRLNDQRIPSPAINKFRYPDPARRPRWGRTQLLRILREPTYKGDAIGWRYAQGGRRRPETEWIWLPTGDRPYHHPCSPVGSCGHTPGSQPRRGYPE